jgi:zinc/manganese transport system substrate-binding protein
MSMTLPRRAFALALLPLPAWAQTAPLRVVASFSILADWVREVGGDAVQVDPLVGPDADAHVFQPRPQHARLLAQAELVFVNGLGFEGWMARLIKASGSQVPVITVSDGLDARLRSGRRDPHIWQNLALAQQAVATIAVALGQARPTQRDAFAARAEAYQAQLAALQARARTSFAALPAAHRHAVTAHDAFGHLAQAFDLRLSAPRGWSTHSEPSAQAVAALIAQLRRGQARAVFAENISDPRLVRRIADEAGARVGGTLYSDALSGPQGPASTYLKLYEHNLNTLLEALR